MNLFHRNESGQVLSELSTLAMGVLCVALTSTTVSAERSAPGSLLILAEYDNTAGTASMVTVTNTNMTSSILTEFRYVEEANCQEFITTELLTPGDTITLLTSAHNPLQNRGFLYVYARDLDGPISFDHLVGQVTTLQATGGYSHNMEAFSFRAGTDLAEGQPTDINQNGQRDFDGLEYEPLPNGLLFPRFLGQTPGQFDTDLILINLTGSVQFDATVAFLVCNDNSEIFSSEQTFHCWERVPLSTVSLLFSNNFLQAATNHDPAEIVGLTSREAGWIRLSGYSASSIQETVVDPAILAVMVGRTQTGSSYAALPFERGTRANGSLIETAAITDTEPGSGLCFGSFGTCPCGNDIDNSIHEGCRNSTGIGARLEGVGSSSFVTDDLRLQVSQAPLKTSGFFLQGGSSISLTLADGRLCIGPPTRRLQFRQTDIHGQAMSSVSLASFVSPGNTVDYQFWFREPNNGGPCGGSSNLSNAYRVSWN